MQKSKYTGLPWMGGKLREEPDPYIYDIDFDDDRYDELREKLADLESRLDDYDNADLEESLGKVADLLDKEQLSEDDLDLVERALDRVEGRMDDYDDREDDIDDDDYLDDYDDYDDDLDDDLDDALLGDDRFDDYDYDSDDF
ncbi:MAG: hypothetical protein NC098_06375 [Lachnoclostridium sp.]|nr:hypothetical protein [Lachnoclostridium sp.]